MGGGGMGVGGYAQMGTALSGSLVGGIGGLIEAQNYHRPQLKPATGPELRLRQLAENQLLGGGQQTLAGVNLYNQLAPILMSQLPGLHYVPGTTGGGAAGGTAAGTGAANDPSQTSPMNTYAQALSNFQQQQGLKQRQTQLKAQISKMLPSPQRRAIRQQLKAVRQQVNQLPDAAALERMMYLGGTQPGNFDIRMGPSGGGDTSGSSPPAPSTSSSLGDINSLLANYAPQTTQQQPDFSALYRGAQTSPGGLGGQNYGFM